MISYNDIIYEYFDPSNSSDFMKLMSIHEQDEQDRVLANLATKLYEHIVNEITDVDFGDIPKSKGDITKIPNYLDMVDSVNIIHDICVRAKQSTEATDTIFKAIDNLKANKAIWRRSFDLNVSLGINTYNTLALAIVCSTSLIISSSIEFIKEPGGNFEFVLDKVEHAKTMNSVLFKSLKEFNKGCENGEFMKAISVANESKRNISECELMSFDENAILYTLLRTARDTLKNIHGGKGAIGTGSVAAGVIGNVGTIALLVAIIIPAIRNAVSWLYNSKQKLSDYFAIQAALVEMNANNLRLNQSKSEAERNKIADKQMKWVSKFRSLSNTLSTKMKKAETASKNTLETEANTKYSGENITNGPGKVSSLF